MYHKLIIIGNLGRDPELRYTPQGTLVTNFSVAANRTYTNGDGERVQETIWFRVSAWGKLAETCSQYLKRGSRVLIEGRLVPDLSTGGPRLWTAQDGTVRASFEVRAEVVRFLSTKADGGSLVAEAQALGGEVVDDLPEPEDEIPF